MSPSIEKTLTLALPSKSFPTLSRASALDEVTFYVFVCSGGVSTQQQEVTVSDGASFDHFGVSVSVRGDTVLIGAHDKMICSIAGHGAPYNFHAEAVFEVNSRGSIVSLALCLPSGVCSSAICDSGLCHRALSHYALDQR